IVSMGDTGINGNDYTIFENSQTSEKKYYRKDNEGNYYELLEGFANTMFDTPLEHVILVDTPLVEYSWTSAPFDFKFTSGPVVAVTAQLRSTIAGYNFSAEINGVNYDNLIEVFTEVLIR